jgi:hypothetical protein
MKIVDYPPHISAKLLQLDETARASAERAEALANALERARDRAFGKRVQADDGLPENQRRLKADLDRLVAETPAAQAQARADANVLTTCRSWLSVLPAGTIIEQVQVTTDGEDLADVRRALKAARDEVAALKAAPTPSPDISERIRTRINELAKDGVTVTGVGANQTLKIVWPGAPYLASGHDEKSANALSVLALLFPEQMATVALAEVERAANATLSPDKRPARLAALHAEIERLQRIESALSDRPAPDAPAEVVLGVRVSSSRGKVAA